MSFSVRNKLKLKRRWPLESAYIYCNTTEFLRIKGIREILHDQLNIQNVFIGELKFENTVEKILKLLENKAPIIPKIDINKKMVAKKVKSDLPILIKEFSKLDIINILYDLKNSGVFFCKYSTDKSIELTEADLSISYLPSDNHISTEKENILLILNISRNEDLIIKGLVRDLSRNIQQLRKELGYNPTEILNYAYISNISKDERIHLTKYLNDIKNLVRVKDVILSENSDNTLSYKSIDIDGKEIKIFIQ